MGARIAETYEVKAGLSQIEAFDVIGLSSRISGNEAASEEINALWQNFFETQLAHRLPNRLDDVIYAVYSDYEGDHTKPYRLTIGYRMKESEPHAVVPEDACLVRVARGDYAMMSAGGEQPKALIETWQAIWQSDLDRCFETDFEVYGTRFFEEGVHEILVAVGIKV